MRSALRVWKSSRTWTLKLAWSWHLLQTSCLTALPEAVSISSALDTPVDFYLEFCFGLGVGGEQSFLKPSFSPNLWASAPCSRNTVRKDSSQLSLDNPQVLSQEANVIVTISAHVGMHAAPTECRPVSAGNSVLTLLLYDLVTNLSSSSWGLGLGNSQVSVQPRVGSNVWFTSEMSSLKGVSSGNSGVTSAYNFSTVEPQSLLLFLIINTIESCIM